MLTSNANPEQTCQYCGRQLQARYLPAPTFMRAKGVVKVFAGYESCECVGARQALDAEAQKISQDKRKEALERMFAQYAKANIPKRFWLVANRNIEDVNRFLRKINARKASEAAIIEAMVAGDTLALESAQERASKCMYTSLVIAGQKGTGKTTFACDIARACVERNIPCYFSSVIGLIDTYKRSFDSRDTGSISALIDRLKTVDVLILDDLGKEIASEWALKEVLYEIIDARYNAQLDTVYTTQYLDTTAMREHLLSRTNDTETVDAILRRIYETSSIYNANTHKFMPAMGLYRSNNNYQSIA